MKNGIAFIFLGIVVVWGGMSVLAQREPMPPDPKETEKPIVQPGPETDPSVKRIREGTTFQGIRVYFRSQGERTVLYTVQDNKRFVCLENLNLERILKAIGDKPDRGVWKVDGMYTEFRGENYVLIQRAVVSPTDFSPGNSGAKKVEERAAKESVVNPSSNPSNPPARTPSAGSSVRSPESPNRP